MAEAFSKAGVTTPEQRLKDIALKAMVAHADDTMAAIEQVWAKVRKDPDLLIALFNPYGEYRAAVGRVFHSLKHDIAVDQSRGVKLDPGRRKVMKIIEAEREERRREEEEQRQIDREREAEEKKRYSEYLASWYKTPLFDIDIGGKYVWEVSAGTVRAWLPTQRKKLRAIELLIEGIPDDGRPIEFYRTPADMMEIWKIVGGED